jgi:exportin-2 (importin alpha re-exporter)
VFYDLNYQELPEFFEDNLSEFMEGFHTFLAFEHPFLQPQKGDVDTPTPQIELRSSVCQTLNLFLEKYDEEFR